MTDFVRREIESAIANATPPAAAVIIGPRRCGKTTFLRNLAASYDGETRWLNCDLPAASARLNFETENDVDAFLRLAPTIVIDEAQRVPNIGLILKMLVDRNELRERPSRIFVTGSSSLDLADGIKESAVVRIAERRMWPFSMKEIAGHRSWGFVEDNLSNFMIYGTYPAAVKDFEGAIDTLTDYVDGILFKDVFKLADIRRSSRFVDLVSLLACRIGSEVSLESLGNDLGINRLTVERYIDLLERCAIIKVVPSYSKNLGNELKKGRKIYFTDLGIRNALIGDFSPLSERPDAGQLWENFFFMERVKIHDTLRDRKRIFFWRTKTNKPNKLDFIEVRNREMEAFECKLSEKAKAKPGKAFLSAYPECRIQVVTPSNALPLLGMTDDE